jgi:hypothetical protein
VDSYSNVVSVDVTGYVYVNGGYAGRDQLGLAGNDYARDGTGRCQLGYDTAGNLTWNLPYSGNLYT